MGFPWSQEGSKFVAEASDFGPLGTALPHCPRCTRAVRYYAQRDREGEITGWRAACPCGAALVVFND